MNKILRKIISGYEVQCIINLDECKIQDLQ